MLLGDCDMFMKACGIAILLTLGDIPGRCYQPISPFLIPYFLYF